MRHVREVLRLRTAGISGNEIARRLNLAPSTVRLTLQRLATAGLSLQVLEHHDQRMLNAALDGQLEQRLEGLALDGFRVRQGRRFGDILDLEQVEQDELGIAEFLAQEGAAPSELIKILFGPGSRWCLRDGRARSAPQTSSSV